jgi:hypothetical protein
MPGIPGPSIPSDLDVGVATDRCLVVASPIDPGSIKVADSIDPGIFAEPRVQGLPVATPGWSRRR